MLAPLHNSHTKIKDPNGKPALRAIPGARRKSETPSAPGRDVLPRHYAKLREIGNAGKKKPETLSASGHDVLPWHYAETRESGNAIITGPVRA